MYQISKAKKEHQLSSIPLRLSFFSSPSKIYVIPLFINKTAVWEMGSHKGVWFVMRNEIYTHSHLIHERNYDAKLQNHALFACACVRCTKHFSAQCNLIIRNRLPMFNCKIFQTNTLMFSVLQHQLMFIKHFKNPFDILNDK